MKIVLTRLDRLGDLILSTPAIRALRRAYPKAEIHLICSPRNMMAVEQNPDLTAFHVAANKDDLRKLARRFQGATMAIALAPRIEDMQFVRATGAKKRLGYTYRRRYGARLTAMLYLTDVVISQADPADCQRSPERPVLHEIDQLLAVVERIGAHVEHPEIVLPVTAADRAAVAAHPAGAVHLHLAPRWLNSGSTEENVLALLRELRIWQRPLVVSYGPDCAEAAARIAAAGVANAVIGGLKFTHWAALIERAACVVTVDTSATHVASAMKRPTVVLFEHRYFELNAREWAPWKVQAGVVRKPAKVNPLSLAACRQELVATVGRLLQA